MGFLCLLGLHSWRFHFDYTSLGRLFYCRRCECHRWEKP